MILYSLASLSLLQHQVESLRMRAEAEQEETLQSVYAVPPRETPTAHLMVDAPPGFFAVWRRVRESGVLTYLTAEFPMLSADVAQLTEVAAALAPPETKPNIQPIMPYLSLYEGEVLHPPTIARLSKHRRVSRVQTRVKKEEDEVDAMDE